MSTRANLSPEHLIRQAWGVFQLRPWLCIAMFLLYTITQPGGGGSGGSGGGSLNDINSMSQAATLMMTAVLAGVGILTLLVLVIAGPMRGGYELAMLRLIRGDQTVVFGDLFAGFSKFINLMITMLLGAFAVAAGVLLCIVPGIILGIGLWPAYLLVMEDDLGPVDALKGAWQLTDGHKMELFVLAIANFILILLGLLACCVGFFVTGPIAQLAWMGAYDEMRRASGAVIAPLTPAAPDPAGPLPTAPPGDATEASTNTAEDDGIDQESDEPTIDSPLEE